MKWLLISLLIMPIPEMILNILRSQPAREERKILGMSPEMQAGTIDDRTASQTIPQNIRDVIGFEESFRNQNYRDTQGFLTTGSGLNLDDPTVASLVHPDVVSGKRGITEEENEAVLDILIPRAEEDAKAVFTEGVFDNLDPARQRVLQSMAFQLGRGGLASFVKLIEATKAGDFERAAAEILDSEAARQTPERFKRNSEQFLRGGD